MKVIKRQLAINTKVSIAELFKKLIRKVKVKPFTTMEVVTMEIESKMLNTNMTISKI
jgi:hypothetical protein